MLLPPLNKVLLTYLLTYEDHEVRTMSCQILSSSMSVVGTRSKLVKYVIFTFILRCYYDAARFSLRLTRSFNVLTTRSSLTHQVQQVLIAFSLSKGRSHHALTTFSLRPSSPYWAQTCKCFSIDLHYSF